MAPQSIAIAQRQLASTSVHGPTLKPQYRAFISSQICIYYGPTIAYVHALIVFQGRKTDTNSKSERVLVQAKIVNYFEDSVLDSRYLMSFITGAHPAVWTKSYPDMQQGHSDESHTCCHTT